MGKTLRNCFDQKLTFQKFLEAEKRAAKGKSLSREVFIFETNLEENVLKMMHELKSGAYKLGGYRKFFVYEPKKREINCLTFRDRVLLQWYVEEFIKPFFEPRMVEHSYACIKGKGHHRAMLFAQKCMQKAAKEWSNFYIVKMDISKFFYSVDRDILFALLSRTIADQKLLNLTKQIVYSYKSGMPIGSLSSQFFANIYLTELDKFMQHNQKTKHYVRYMDDFIAMAKDKQSAKQLFHNAARFIKQKLNLSMNPKSGYCMGKMGCQFCGYKVAANCVKLLRKQKEKLRRLFAEQDPDALSNNIHKWWCAARWGSGLNYLRDTLSKRSIEIEWVKRKGQNETINA